MEKKFLSYLLYISLVEMREHAHETSDKKIFWLCHLLHNIPLHLDSEENAKETYTRLLENAESLGLQKWLATREEEFNSQNSE